MASDVEICNIALTKVGASRITTLLDETKQAKALNAIFTSVRDSELAKHPWSFAIKRAEIPASATEPTFGWQKAYPLPSDCLKLVQVGDSYVFYDTGEGSLFDVEGRAVLTDEPAPLQVRYVYRITNAGLLPALFVDVFACKLAMEVNETLAQNNTKREMAAEEYKQAVREAKRANAIERPPQYIPDFSWVREMKQR